MSLSEQELELAVSKTLYSLDEVVGGGDQGGPTPLKNYYHTIGIHNIKSLSAKGRLARKTLAPFDKVIKKLFQGYFEQRTLVDTYLRDMAFANQQGINNLKAHIDKDLDEKIFETHKLIDGFKKEILAGLADIEGAGTKKTDKLQTKIINPDRVEKLKRVNIGSGRDTREDYINVDHRAIEGVDVVADVRDLPFKAGSLDEVFASHVAEHFLQRELTKIIQYWFTLVAKGGSIRLIVPNIDAMARRYAAGELTWDELRSVVLGGQDYASDYHYNQFSVESMEAFVKHALPEAKFTIVEAARRNGECYEMEVLITKA